MTEITEQKQVGWLKGQSGNPAGRPKGAKNKTTLAAESLLKDHAEAITQKVIDLALEGDLTALKMCLDRVLPVPKKAIETFSNVEIYNNSVEIDVTQRVLSLLTHEQLKYILEQEKQIDMQRNQKI